VAQGLTQNSTPLDHPPPPPLPPWKAEGQAAPAGPRGRSTRGRPWGLLTPCCVRSPLMTRLGPTIEGLSWAPAFGAGAQRWVAPAGPRTSAKTSPTPHPKPQPPDQAEGGPWAAHPTARAGAEPAREERGLRVSGVPGFCSSWAPQGCAAPASHQASSSADSWSLDYGRDKESSPPTPRLHLTARGTPSTGRPGAPFAGPWEPQRAPAGCAGPCAARRPQEQRGPRGGGAGRKSGGGGGRACGRS